MSKKQQLTQMSQFSIIREMPGNKRNNAANNNTVNNNTANNRPSELKFKIEPIGIQPEDDDDLETCPSRTRTSWPHQITPWWKPTDRYEKPPYSYATLIAHAILTSKDGRLTLSDIYKWISEAYPYYRRGEKGWQNSIRHNLSLNKKWFIKVDRRPTQAHPGKGGYWTLQMNMEKIFVDNLCRTEGHSRRHHDMGMYSSLSTQYYGSTFSEGNEDIMNIEDLSPEASCPNILITRPEDYEAKKAKAATIISTNTVSAPRIRNMTPQEKKKMMLMTNINENVTSIPKTDPQISIIKFNPLDSGNKRKSNPSRPAPKSGKRRSYVEPGSSTSEDGDSAVEMDDEDLHIAKKRKSSTTASDVIIDTISASPYDMCYTDMYSNTRPSDLINTIPVQDMSMNLNNDNDFWLHDESSNPSLLLTSQYPPLSYDTDAQNILQGLQAPTQQHPEMKIIDLSFSPLQKNIHYPQDMTTDKFTDSSSQLYIDSNLLGYNLDQYSTEYNALPSNVLLEQETMNSYWPQESTSCFMGNDFIDLIDYSCQDLL